MSNPIIFLFLAAVFQIKWVITSIRFGMSMALNLATSSGMFFVRKITQSDDSLGNMKKRVEQIILRSTY